jgi:hypothetical protein
MRTVKFKYLERIIIIQFNSIQFLFIYVQTYQLRGKFQS